MSSFLLFTVKIENSQNAKHNFLRQRSFYKARYLIFDLKNNNMATLYNTHFRHISSLTCKENKAYGKEKGLLMFSVYVIKFKISLCSLFFCSGLYRYSSLWKIKKKSKTGFRYEHIYSSNII